MNAQKGDHVLVNLAPFIGSTVRSEESVLCEVLASDGVQVHVRALPPYRPVSLWVLATWIDACRLDPLGRRQRRLVGAMS